MVGNYGRDVAAGSPCRALGASAIPLEFRCEEIPVVGLSRAGTWPYFLI